MSIYCQKAPSEAAESVKMIEISRISVNPNQPRKVFAHEAILKLADSIRQYGIIQPLCVRKIGENYELISGERRLRASKELGLNRARSYNNKGIVNEYRRPKLAYGAVRDVYKKIKEKM